MALDNSALLELTKALRSADDGDLMRRLLHTMLQALIDAEAAPHIGADPYERTETRTTQRNGTRTKTVSTTQRADVLAAAECSVSKWPFDSSRANVGEFASGARLSVRRKPIFTCR